MNMIVVFQDQATKQCQEGKPYAFASALEVRCVCGNLIHPIPGAWCTLCGLKVVEVRQEHTPMTRRAHQACAAPNALSPSV
jgi:hypothetical protein